MHTRHPFAIVAVLLALLAPLLGAGQAHAAGRIGTTPQIQLSTNVALAGASTTLSVTGSGFTANAAITVRLDNAAIGTAQTDSSGTFASPALTVQAVAAGQHTISATDAASVAATQPFYAGSITVSPTSASLGSPVRVSGQGFPPAQPVTIQLAGQTLSPAGSQTDQAGNFAITITVPNLPAGSQQLQVAIGSNQLAGNLLIVIAQPVLALNPATVDAGGSFTVGGTGYPAGATLAVKLDGTTLGTVFPTNGSISFTFSVPGNTPAGQHQVTIVDSTNRTLASATLVVRAQPSAGPAGLSVSPGSGIAGARLTVAGANFQPGETVLIQINGATVTTTQANGQGQIDVSFTLAQGFGAGPLTLVATGQTSHRTASAGYSIGAAGLSLNPTTSLPGGQITVSGRGFAAGEGIALSLNGAPLASGTADGGGNFNVPVTLPATLAAGTATVTASGQISHQSASATLTVSTSARISLSGSTIQAGGTVTVTGSGFAANEAVVISIPGATLATVGADGQGAFTATVTVPGGQAAGNLAITATGQVSHRSTGAQLVVTIAPRISLNIGAVQPGAGVVVTGSGFGPNEPVAIAIAGNAALATVAANAQGAFAATVTIPYTLGPSGVQITATGQQTHRAVSAALTILALPIHLAVGVGPVYPGGSVALSGGGFQPGEQVVVSLAGHTVLITTANGQGAFSTLQVALPAGVGPGAYSLIATGQSSRRTVNVGVSIVARPAASITVSPSTFTAGTPVRISGSGFRPQETVQISINGGAPFTTPITGANGTFVITLTLPGGLPAGNLRIVATGAASKVTASAIVQFAAPAPTPPPPPVSVTAGSTTWYFAAGRTDAGFSEQIAVLNPNGRDVHGTITLYYGTDQIKTYPFSLRPTTRGTYDVGQILGTQARVAAMVQADAPIAVARTTQRGAEDRMATTGVAAPARIWYMAEGYTSLTFQEELDLLNPGNQPARVHIVWPQFNGKAPVAYDLTLGPRSHQTIPVNSRVDRASHATVVSADQPIVASRTILFGARQQGADSKAGVTGGSRTLYFAEGSTNNGFEEYLTILNPSATAPARVTATFYDRAGLLLGTRTIVIDAMHRGNIKVNDVTRNTAIATVLQSDQPVVAERSMYFGAPNGGTGGGTVVFGVPTPALGWAFATGNSQPGYAEFELLFNPNATASSVEATYYADNGQVVRSDFTLAARSRLNIDLNRSVPGLPRGYHGLILRSTNGVPFVAEQAIYTNNLGNGSATVGTPLQ